MRKPRNKRRRGVEVRIEAGHMVAAIADGSREEPGPQQGDDVTVFITSTEVLIAK